MLHKPNWQNESRGAVHLQDNAREPLLLSAATRTTRCSLLLVSLHPIWSRLETALEQVHTNPGTPRVNLELRSEKL